MNISINTDGLNFQIGDRNTGMETNTIAPPLLSEFEQTMSVSAKFNKNLVLVKWFLGIPLKKWLYCDDFLKVT